MNMNLATLPLPSMGDNRCGQRRRQRIAGLDLGARAMRRFQLAAESLHPQFAVPDIDAIASAARHLKQQFAGTWRAPCIQLRLRCLTALRAMSQEQAWGLAVEKQERIALIDRYASAEERLIPHAVPVVGGLDDALLVDLAWPSLQPDLDDYLSFRRLRTEEAAMRGKHAHEIAYGREQWEESRLAEIRLLARSRACGREDYAATAVPFLFRFH